MPERRVSEPSTAVLPPHPAPGASPGRVMAPLPMRVVGSSGRLERVRGHRLPLAALAALGLTVMRNVLFGHGVPAGVDSAFLYSNMRLYNAHHVLAFTGWAPEPFGQAQQYSIYWLLAMLTALSGSVGGVYDLALVTTFLVAALGSYRLAFWISGSRLGAVVAAALYVLAPFSIAQWLAGHLNVEISYALGPWLIWTLWRSLRSGSGRAMVGLGLAGSACYLLTTGQGVYWLLPLSTVVVAEAFQRRHAARAFATRLTKTVLVAAAVFTLASAVELLPLAAGVRAPFVDTGSRFYIQSLAIHAQYSEPFMRNVVGIPTEDWSRSNLAGGSYDGVAYWVLAIALLLFAASALVTNRRRMAAALSLRGFSPPGQPVRQPRSTKPSTTIFRTSACSECRTAGSWCRHSASRCWWHWHSVV
jgi:hypothetical protein